MGYPTPIQYKNFVINFLRDLSYEIGNGIIIPIGPQPSEIKIYRVLNN